MDTSAFSGFDSHNLFPPNDNRNDRCMGLWGRLPQPVSNLRWICASKLQGLVSERFARCEQKKLQTGLGFQAPPDMNCSSGYRVRSERIEIHRNYLARWGGSCTGSSGLIISVCLFVTRSRIRFIAIPSTRKQKQLSLQTRNWPWRNPMLGGSTRIKSRWSLRLRPMTLDFPNSKRF